MLDNKDSKPKAPPRPPVPPKETGKRDYLSESTKDKNTLWSFLRRTVPVTHRSWLFVYCLVATSFVASIWTFEFGITRQIFSIFWGLLLLLFTIFKPR